MDSLSSHVIIRKMYSFQAGIGISANMFLLFLHIFMMLQDSRAKPTDLITCHLALVHTLMLFITLDILFPNLFESLNLQRDFKCKASFYLYRVMRGLSICNTCLLSVLQAITISPRTSRVGRINQKFTNYITQNFFFWSLNLLFSSDIIFSTVAYSSTNHTSVLSINKYCSIFPIQAVIKQLFLMLTLSRDIFFVGLMMLSSAYMVFLLSRHQRRSRHLHGPNLSPRASPEQRATQTILLLASFFVVMYWMNLIISTFSTLLWTYNPVLLNVQNLILNAYATVCPLVQTAYHRKLKDTVRTILWKSHQHCRRQCWIFPYK